MTQPDAVPDPHNPLDAAPNPQDPLDQHLILRTPSDAIPNLPEINEESVLSSFLTLVTRITIDVMLSND